MKVTKEAIFSAIRQSKSMAEAASILPIHFHTFKTYAKKLGVYNTNQSGKGTTKYKAPKYTLSNILKGEHPHYSTNHLRLRLVKELKWELVCAICKIKTWCNKPISFELDHIDGNSNNHKLKNLRLLCPTCHTQTYTYGNKKR